MHEKNDMYMLDTGLQLSLTYKSICIHDFFSRVYGLKENRQTPYQNGSTCLKKRQYPKYRAIPSNSQLNLFPAFSFIYTGDALLKAVHLKFCLLQYERQN